MKKTLKLYGKALFLFIIFAFCSCSQGKKISSDELNIYVPAAPPAIPLYKSAETLKNLLIHQYTDVASEALPAILKEEEALFVIPTNLAAKLYNKNGNIVLITILSTGMLNIVSTNSDITSIESLDGRKVYIGAPGSSPDVIARYIFSTRNTKPDIEYSSTPEIAKLIIAGKIENAVLPEPMASSVLIRSKENIFKIADLKSEWIKLHPGTQGMPQVAIAANRNFFEKRRKDITTLVSDLKNSVQWTNSNLEEAGTLGEETAGLSIPKKIISQSVSAMNLTCRSATESREDIEIYLKALYEMDPKTVGDKLPDSPFYAF